MTGQCDRFVLRDHGMADYVRAGHTFDLQEVSNHMDDLVFLQSMYSPFDLVQLLLDLVLILHAAPRYDDELAEDPLFVYRRAGTMTRIKKMDKACRSVLREDGLLERHTAYFKDQPDRPYGTGLAVTPKGMETAESLVASDTILSKFGGLDAEETVTHCLGDARRFATEFMAHIYQLTKPVVVLSKPDHYRSMAHVRPMHQPLVTAALSTLADWHMVAKSSGRYRRVETFARAA